MCFSATASFTSSAILTGAGILALSRTRSALERPFAAIPLLFAAQQFAEGCLWLGLGSSHDAGVRASTYIFLFFAQILWPIWIPISMMYMETDLIRRRILLLLSGLGGSLSIYMAACLIIFGSRADIIGHHIFYTDAYPIQFVALSGIAYGLTTILSAWAITASTHLGWECPSDAPPNPATASR